MNFEAVMGLEVHVQLKTKSKIFCSCSTHFDARENENICPVCTGMPGSLPVLNEEAVHMACKMALATNCKVQSVSVFARKNYFYPDLPKGYQISQYDQPLAIDGWVEIPLSNKEIKKIRLERIHMEEDAGKNVHGSHFSYVNFNRAGIPLIEVVSKPDLRSSEEAGNYLRSIQRMVRYLEIGDGNMEEGSLRCDVNISLRPTGAEKLGTKVEIKNMNSFRFVENAIEYEIERQKEALQNGQKIIQETRLWDSNQNKTFSMRSKEEAHDYRYFPEPDLMPLEVSSKALESIKTQLPELSLEKQKRFMRDYQLSQADSGTLVQEKSLADYFEAVVKECQAPRLASNWILSELLREVEASSVSKSKITPKHLGQLILLIQKGTISGKIAKTVFEKMLQSGDLPQKIVETEGWVQISDDAELEPIIEAVVKENPNLVKAYQAGDAKKFGFFVGQVMKKTQGQANPQKVNELLKKKLGDV